MERRSVQVSPGEARTLAAAAQWQLQLLRGGDPSSRAECTISCSCECFQRPATAFVSMRDVNSAGGRTRRSAPELIQRMESGLFGRSGQIRGRATALIGVGVFQSAAAEQA